MNAMPVSLIDGKKYTAWTMGDGNIMAGVLLESPFFGTYRIQRVDGTVCNVAKGLCRPATVDDIEAACKFFGLKG